MYGMARRQTTWAKRKKKRFPTINEPIAIVLIKISEEKVTNRKTKFETSFLSLTFHDNDEMPNG